MAFARTLGFSPALQDNEYANANAAQVFKAVSDGPDGGTGLDKEVLILGEGRAVSQGLDGPAVFREASPDYRRRGGSVAAGSPSRGKSAVHIGNSWPCRPLDRPRTAPSRAGH